MGLGTSYNNIINALSLQFIFGFGTVPTVWYFFFLSFYCIIYTKRHANLNKATRSRHVIVPT